MDDWNILLKIVEELNEEAFDASDDEEMSAFSYSGNGYCVVVEFLGTTIWSTEVDSFWTDITESVLKNGVEVEQGREMKYDEIKAIILDRAIDLSTKIAKTTTKMKGIKNENS